MKKKFINGLLIVATIVVASSSFVSCTDRESDNYAELREQNATIIQVLQGQIDAMKNYCLKTDCKAAHDALNERIVVLETWISEFSHQSLDDYYTKEQVDSIIRALDLNNQAFVNSIVAIINQEAENWPYVSDEELDSILANYMVTGDFASKDTLGGYVDTTAIKNYVTHQELIDSLKNYAKKADLDSLRKWVIGMDDSLKSVYTQTAYNLTRINGLRDTLNNALDSIGHVEKRALDSITNTRAFLLDSITKVQEEAYKNYLEVKGIAEDAAKEAAKALLLAQEDSMRIDKLEMRIESVKTAMEEADKKLSDRIDALKKDVEQNKKDIKALKDDVAELQQDVANLLGTVKKLITGIIVQGTYNPVFGTFNLPFGIQSNVLAAHYGTAMNGFDFPAADNDYYVGGTDSKGVYQGGSPLSQAELNLIAANGGLPEIVEKSNGDVLINESDDNAGLLYLTVNPSNVDFDNTNFTLRTTDNQESNVKLAPLQASTDRLDFGYTRGAASNGFYVAKASIAKDVILNNPSSVTPNFELKKIASTLKNELKSAKQNRQFNISSIARLVYENSSSILPRLGVQTEWKDSTGDRAVVSEYSLAATAIKPLGFDFLYDNTIKPKKWIDRKFGKFGKVNEDFEEVLRDAMGDMEGMKIEEVIVKRKEDRGYVVLLPIQSVNLGSGIAEPTAWDADGNPTAYSWYGYPVYAAQDTYGDWRVFYNPNTVDMVFVDGYMYVDVTEVADVVYEDLNEGLKGYNDNVEGFNKAIDDLLKNMPSQVSEKLNDYQNRVNKYINKLNKAIGYGNKAISYVNAYLNRINLYLQPAMFVAGSDGSWKLLSRWEKLPSRVKAGETIELLPTTYTLETISPAYMKHVAVSNVFKGNTSAGDGDAACKAAMTKANEVIGSKNIIQGVKKFTKFEATSDMKGMTFEIVYTAAGYNGYLAGDKYYVTVE